LLLAQVLARAGFDTVEAADGDEGLRQARSERPDLVVLDLGLPRVDGFEVCRRLRADAAFSTLPIIVLTGRSDLGDVVAALDAGADDFVAKPFRQPELLARIRSALRLRAAYEHVQGAHAVVAALANAVEAKDQLTEDHCQRLASLSVRLAAEAGIGGPELEWIALGALLHDVGKIGVPESVLGKPGPLSDEEWALMRRHPEIGERICQPLAFAAQVRPMIRHHHERWDGRGYPDALRAEAIPLGARIIGIVDAFDAMTHDRPYRPSLDLDQAIDEVRRNVGHQFDPDLAPSFMAIIEGRSMEPDEPEPMPTLALLGLARPADRVREHLAAARLN
jgi:putative two-component system response regulator